MLKCSWQGPDSVHETFSAIYGGNYQMQGVFYGHDEPYFVCTHSVIA